VFTDACLGQDVGTSPNATMSPRMLRLELGRWYAPTALQHSTALPALGEACVEIDAEREFGVYAANYISRLGLDVT